jgi:small ligand-binding sensory domain FIST
MAVIEAGGNESYLRAIQGTDPASGSVFVAGSIPAGAVVQLTTADTEDILAGAEAALVRASAEFPAGAQPEAALIFSCAVRRFLLGSRTGVEAELARSVYGPSMPMAGLYCFGEIGPVPGAATSRFFNETFTTVLLGT